MSSALAHSQRVGVRATGIVQGVGFRPAVCRMAAALGLSGSVRNEGGSVWIEVEGTPERIERFVAALRAGKATAARIEELEVRHLEPCGGSGFLVAPSRGGADADLAALPPDLGPCAACLREIDDPADRRHRHAFASCVACGPRYTVARELPWDRQRTSMAPFPLCTACNAEYGDPSDRRFHAETIACPACGPQLRYVRGGVAIESDPLAEAARDLLGGAIVAVKGVGGYLLAVDACEEGAVAALRERKRRPHKPFAVMARDREAAASIARLDGRAREILASPRRPIVIAERIGDRLAPSVAPGLSTVGVFLPPSPLQHLLARLGPELLVMTSGNLRDEPIAIDDEEALRRLAGIADAFLIHDRVIVRRADDSVVRLIGGAPVPLRRARGWVPEAIELGFGHRDVALGVGGASKNTICLAAEGRASLSAHLGDLSQPEARAAFAAAIDEMQRLAGRRAAVVAHDLHPDYPSTRWALESGLPAVAVQHHHAHFASCLAEHRRSGPALGVIFDGTGFGTDGTLWGGEILFGGLGGFQRVAHLAPLRLPGGEAAIRAPWRIALAALVAAGEPAPFAGPEADAVGELLRRGIASPLATGAGRWFDAVAALCGLCSVASWDGQAAALLESCAGDRPAEPYPFELREGTIDLLPAIAAVARELRRGVAREEVAARFHETVAAATAACCGRLDGPRVVVLSGGCFQNRRLAESLRARLEAMGFEVLLHRQVPCNDGGLSLGQAAVAAWRDREGGG